MNKIKAEITAYYPSNEGVEGGYFDALGKPLNPEHNTCACPSCIPFHTKIKITGTNTKYDIESVLDCNIPLTVIEEKTLTSGSVWCKCKAGYWVNKKYLHFIRYV